MANKKIPSHAGFIPDGNRRWAMDDGLSKEAGEAHGIDPGFLLYEKCKNCRIKEVSSYCFTPDNPKPPSSQKQTFSEASGAFAFEIAHRGALCWLSAMKLRGNSPKC
jgi:undecaprenyl diphosphate synthase